LDPFGLGIIRLAQGSNKLVDEVTDRLKTFIALLMERSGEPPVQRFRRIGHK